MRRVFVFLLLALMLCSGCGKDIKIQAPELLEPVAVNSAYRPVEREDIGAVELLMGIVVPATYGCAFRTTVKVSELTVRIGDYVEEGDIIAYADTADAEERLAAVGADLAHANRLHELNCGIDRERQYQIELGRAWNEQYAVEMATARENAYYDGLLYEYRVEKMNQEIAALQAEIADACLYAPHSGYVTWVKDFAKGSATAASEEIVRISDMEDCYIEVSEVPINRYCYEAYEVKYVKLAGNVYAVSELPYTIEERVLASITGSYPPVRFVLEKTDIGSEAAAEEKDGRQAESRLSETNPSMLLHLGDSCPIYFMEKSIRDVLVIGKDSLYEENGSYYVYVQGENGERERRTVTIGETDACYAQVTDGLTDGELVYYESEVRMPTEYSTCQTVLSDFEIKNYTTTYSLSRPEEASVRCKYSGKITEVAVKEGQEVAEGELLYTVDIGEGKAALTKARYAIEQEARSFEAQLRALDIRAAEIQKQSPLDESARSNLRIIAYERDIVIENHAYEQPVLQEEYDRISQENDGTGLISIFAETSGIADRVYISVGDTVSVGQEAVCIGSTAGDMLLMQMKKPTEITAALKDLNFHTDNIADIGETIWIDGKDGFKGQCVGRDENKNFYVKLEDTSFYETMPKGKIVSFSYLYMSDVIVVPTRFVKEETTRKNNRYSYVWRVVDGELVKQYVTVDRELMDGTEIVILSGVKAGDVLAAE